MPCWCVCPTTTASGCRAPAKATPPCSSPAATTRHSASPRSPTGPVARWRSVSSAIDGRGASRAASLRLDAALLHDALPLAHFLHHEGAEFGRAHAHGLHALRGELLLHPGRVEDRRDLIVQPRRDGGR